MRAAKVRQEEPTPLPATDFCRPCAYGVALAAYPAKVTWWLLSATILCFCALPTNAVAAFCEML